MTMRLSRNDPRFHALALMASKLTTHGMTQEQASKRLDISQPQVSRLLTYARDQGWLLTQHKIEEAKVPADLLEMMKRELLTHERLDALLAGWTPQDVRCRVRVVDALDDDFCRLAADWVGDLLVTSDLIGVMYGWSVSRVVAAVAERHRRHPPRPAGLQVIPVCAEPVHLLNAARDDLYSSTHLAAELHESLTGKPHSDLPSLRAVPAYVAPELGKATVAAIRTFVNTVPGYRRIFIEDTGFEKSPLIDRVDTILTGVGRFAPPRGKGRTGTLILERMRQNPKLTLEGFRQWIFGDIGGVLLSRPDADAKARKAVQAMNEGLFGLTEDHFRDTARRATQTDKPGCVVVAGGPGRAELVCAAVQKGMVNELFVNSECAAELEALPEAGVL